MRISYHILIFMTLQREVQNIAAKKWFDQTLHQLSTNYTFHQVILFINNYTDTAEKNYVIKKVVQSRPTIIIDVSREAHLYGFTILKSMTISKLQTSSLYVVMENVENIATSNSVFDLLNYLAPDYARPKCLVVLFIDKDVKNIDEKVTKMLTTAWIFKFLYFSIMIVNQDNRPMLYSYNPFTNQLHRSYFEDITSIFPDKLSNMNQYPITIPIYDYPPMMNFSFTKEKVIDVDGHDLLFVVEFSKRLNFSLNYITFPLEPSDPDFFDLIYEKLQIGEINMLGTQYLVGANLYNNSIVIGKQHFQNKFIMLAPLLPQVKLSLPKYVIVYLSLIPFIVLCYVATAYLLKLPSSDWKLHNIFQVLLGYSLSAVPKDLTQRVLFFSLLLVAINYSTDAFSKLTDVQAIHGEVSFDTAEEIVKSKVHVYAPEFVHKQSFDDPNEIVGKLKSKIKLLHQENCVKLLLKHKNCICISPYRSGKYLADQAKLMYRRPMIKIVKTAFLYDYLAFAYESASPYMEKFSNILQRMIETGIPKSGDEPTRSLNYEDMKKIKTVLMPQLVWILGVGYFISYMTFIIELSWKKVSA